MCSIRTAAAASPFTTDPWPTWHSDSPDGAPIAGLVRPARARRRRRGTSTRGDGAACALTCGPFSPGATITPCITRTRVPLRRTVRTARASTGGPMTDPAGASARQRPYGIEPDVVLQLPLHGRTRPRPGRHGGFVGRRAGSPGRLARLATRPSGARGLARGSARELRRRVEQARTSRGAERQRRAAVRDAARPRRRRLSRAPRQRHDDRRRLSVVHRLGPRHVHRHAWPLPGDWPARRGARHPARVGAAVSEGMLPNRFPDGGESPEFNAVDASLWFVVAVHDCSNAPSAERWLDRAERARRSRRC